MRVGRCPSCGVCRLNVQAAYTFFFTIFSFKKFINKINRDILRIFLFGSFSFALCHPTACIYFGRFLAKKIQAVRYMVVSVSMYQKRLDFLTKIGTCLYVGI